MNLTERALRLYFENLSGISEYQMAHYCPPLIVVDRLKMITGIVCSGISYN